MSGATLSLSPQEQKQLIEAEQALRQRVRDDTDEAQYALVSNLIILCHNIENAFRDVRNTQDGETSVTGQISDKLREIENLKRKYDQQNATLYENSADLADSVEQLKDFERLYVEEKRNYDNEFNQGAKLKDQLKEAEDNQRKLKSKLDETIVKINKLNRESDDAQKKYNRLTILVNNNKDTYFQEDQRIKDLERQIETRESDIASLDALIAQLEEKIKQVNRDINRLKDNEKALDNFANKPTEVRQKWEQSVDALQEYERGLNELANQMIENGLIAGEEDISPCVVTEQQIKINKFEQRIRDRRAAIQAEKTKKEIELKELTNEYNNALEMKNQRRDELAQFTLEKNRLNERLKQRSSESLQTENELNAADRLWKDKITDLTTAKNDESNINNEIAKLDSDIELLNKELANKTADIRDAHKRKDESRLKLSELRDSLKDKYDRLGDLIQDFHLLSNHLINLRSEVRKMGLHYEATRGDITKSNDNLRSARREIADHLCAGEIDSLRRRNKQLEQSLADSSSSKTVEADCEIYKQQLERERAIVAELRDENERLRQELDALRSQTQQHIVEPSIVHTLVDVVTTTNTDGAVTTETKILEEFPEKE
ncbi:laminin subunit lamb4 [Acrasis kona]|uniref:Laminin subunit lamb4 n=1 Tax=Acrasis kona TaxID=1008807 RepID=A0AAW2Z4T1_9EUKA